jgi:peptide/nickel transport system ATP-binding protein
MLKVQNLSVEFQRYHGGFRKRPLTVITELDLDVTAGEIVAVVGSSGAGKSLLAHAVLGILPRNARVTGEISFKNTPLTKIRQQKIRGKEIALIPQSVNFLNPLSRVGSQVFRAAQLSGLNSAEAAQARDRSFERYHLADRVKSHFPFQISGGMARRVLTATATAGKAELIIADEPTTGLDPAVIFESLAHLRELADEGKGVILITHDIMAALQVADRIAVFYAGTTVEIASVQDFNGINRLRHPYTKALWKSLPQHEFHFVPGSQPSPDNLPRGCLFAPRCELRKPECEYRRPELRRLHGGLVRCFNA